MQPRSSDKTHRWWWWWWSWWWKNLFIYWKTTWCQLLFCALYTFSHLILATTLWRSYFYSPHVQLRTLRHRRLGNLSKIKQIEYDTSNFTPQPALHRSPFYGRLTESMGTNGSNVANQNNHTLPKLKKTFRTSLTMSQRFF